MALWILSLSILSLPRNPGKESARRRRGSYQQIGAKERREEESEGEQRRGEWRKGKERRGEWRKGKERTVEGRKGKIYEIVVQ